jgi:hypothetical protein
MDTPRRNRKLCAFVCFRGVEDLNSVFMTGDKISPFHVMFWGFFY